MQAGFGKSGRGYVSKIEHHQIKRLGQEQLAAIAHALGLVPHDLQESRLPEPQASQRPDKGTLDDAIAGCKGWLRVYTQDDKRLDRARTYLKLAELCRERLVLAKEREERNIILMDARQSIDQALVIFHNEAPDSYEKAQHIHAMIVKEIYIQDLDDAIVGCKALLRVYHQEKQPLDWARTHVKLAQIYWDRAALSEQEEECETWLSKALQSIDHALPHFHEQAPVSYTQAQRMRLDIEGAREAMLG